MLGWAFAWLVGTAAIAGYSVTRHAPALEGLMRDDVRETIAGTPGGGDISVAVRDHVATLSGTVGDIAERDALLAAAGDGLGIRRVVDRLVVDTPVPESDGGTRAGRTTGERMRRVTANGGMDGRPRLRVAGGGAVAFVLSCVIGGLGVLPGKAPAQSRPPGVLAECATLSPLLDDIHACLDDYLAVMDERLAGIGRLVSRTLDDDALAAFERSQRAFADFRRDNCVWYLSFSTPRDEAEQIAKDCLARMSLDRLTELQGLLSESGGDAPKSGYYVYGAERNTFRPCGSEARYWVEGDVAVVGALQQDYLEVATDERQVLFARLDGVLDESAIAPDGHSGVLRASALVELRVPRESDCRLAGGTSPVAAANAVGAPPPASVVADADPPPVEPAALVEPEQQLIAYFGAWLADCTESAGARACALSTVLEGGDDASGPAVAGAEAGSGGGSGADGDGQPTLSLIRPGDGRTRVELRLPGREIDSPARLRWSVDGDVLGDIVGSSIRVDAAATRQLVDAGAYVDEELLPRMIAGGELAVEVLAAIDDARGERYRATLVGVTRALAFADDFVRDGGGL